MKSLEYLPEYLRDNELVEIIADLIDQVSPLDSDIQSILNRYDPYEALQNFDKVVQEMGFDYVRDPFQLDDDQKAMFIFILYLLNVYKGRREGMRLLFDILGLNYQIVAWYEDNPLGQEFTYRLELEAGADNVSAEFLRKLQRFCYEYVLPLLSEFSVNYFSEVFNLLSALGGFVDRQVDKFEEVIQLTLASHITGIFTSTYGTLVVEV